MKETTTKQQDGTSITITEKSELEHKADKDLGLAHSAIWGFVIVMVFVLIYFMIRLQYIY